MNATRRTTDTFFNPLLPVCLKIVFLCIFTPSPHRFLLAVNISLCPARTHLPFLPPALRSSGNIPKLAIGLVTLFYDSILIFQHYVLYKGGARVEPVVYTPIGRFGRRRRSRGEGEEEEGEEDVVDEKGGEKKKKKKKRRGGGGRSRADGAQSYGKDRFSFEEVDGESDSTDYEHGEEREEESGDGGRTVMEREEKEVEDVEEEREKEEKEWKKLEK